MYQAPYPKVVKAYSDFIPCQPIDKDCLDDSGIPAVTSWPSSFAIGGQRKPEVRKVGVSKQSPAARAIAKGATERGDKGVVRERDTCAQA